MISGIIRKVGGVVEVIEVEIDKVLLVLWDKWKSTGIEGIRRFYVQTSKLAYKWINRRSQKKSFTYAQYCKFGRYNPLPELKIYHLTYTLFPC